MAHATCCYARKSGSRAAREHVIGWRLSEPADNRVLWHHRALAAVLGVVLRLPPIKQVMASQQVKSRYMEYLITHIKL
jgi:hypothetical protein